MKINKDLSVDDVDNLLYGAYCAEEEKFRHYLGNRLGPRKIPKFPKKLPGTIWAITTFFNPARYKNKYENYMLFRESSKRQGLNLLTVELNYGDIPFEIQEEDADILVRVHGEDKNHLWQKEPMMNIALKYLPEDCDKVIWIDCDLLFHNNNWVAETASLLEEYNVVQPYTMAIRLPQFCKSSKAMKNIQYGVRDCEIIHGIAKGVDNLGDDLFSLLYQQHGHVGFAWAARKEILDEIGFFTAMISGANDSVMAYAFYGLDWYKSIREFLPDLADTVTEWRIKAFEKVQGSVFHTSGIVDHLWHGNKIDRGYNGREQLFIDHNFNPKIDVRESESGLLEWCTKNKKLKKAIQDHLHSKKEDSSIIEAETKVKRDSGNGVTVIKRLEASKAERILYPAFDGDEKMFQRYIDFRLGRISVPTFSKKLPGTIWAITTFFNPAKYKNKYENYKKFRESSKRQGLKLLTVELRFDNEAYEIQDEDTDILLRLQGCEENILWQKEALLNIAVENLPSDCDKVIWLDCDLIFHNDNWVKETAELLEEYNVVQPFSSIVRLKQDIDSSDLLGKFDYDYNDNGVFHSAARGAASFGVKILSDPVYKNRGSVGYAWAIRKTILDKVKFFDLMILGGADSVIGYAAFGEEWAMSRHYLPSKLKEMNDEWSEKFYAQTQGSVFYTNGLVDHLWHGDQEDRNYNERYQILRSNDFDPDEDLKRSNSGLLEWNTSKVKLKEGAKQYFHIRKEQGQLN